MPLKEIENMKGATDCPDERDFMAEHILGAAEVELPASVDLNVTPSHHQGKSWHCVAYSLTHIEEILNTLEFNMKALADPEELWANMKMEQGNPDYMETEGTSLQAGLQALLKYGLYNKATAIPVEKFNITGYAMILNNITDCKKWLAKRFPIFTGSDRHCYALTGYNKTAFVAKNSYGPEWGKKKDGTFEVPFDEFSKLYTKYIIFDKSDMKLIFKDVTENSPFAEDIKACRDLGLLNGYGTGTDPVQKFFKPEQPVTRAEMAAVINRLYKKLTA